VNGRTYNCYISRVEPLPVAEQPAGLVVQAGRYYRTRDGRKVQAKCAADWDDFVFRAGGNHYNADGSHFYGEEHKDLVAEWVEPESPVIAVATPEPAAAPAKFKVGDRVTPKAERLRQVISHWNEHWRDDQGEAVGHVFFVRRDPSPHLGLSISATLGGEGPWWPEEYFEPAPTPVGAAPSTTDFIVARITPAGQPRPNARPRVHTTLASATAEASRLANRLGDEFAVYQRVATESVDAGPVPSDKDWPFNARLAKIWLAEGVATNASQAFDWARANRGFTFWATQAVSGLTPLGREILRKWIAEAEANATTKEAA
jgi:hypothetical protein